MTGGRAGEEPRWLSLTSILAIHAQQVERYGGAHGVRDPGMVRSAAARLRNRWAYDEEADLADVAAAYLVGLGRSQGFVDGNKRTGLASALVFLRLNGLELHVPPEEIYALTMGVAAGEVEDGVVAAYLRDRMSDASE